MELKIIVFGATGMLGSAVLDESLKHPQVQSVLVIGRRSCEVRHSKLTELIHSDFMDYSAIEDKLAGYNACFFCLGVSSVGMTEADYKRITVDYAEKAARLLSRLNPDMSFCFISGAGSDDTLQSKRMWARVKGQAENVVKAFPFRQVFILRPAFVLPLAGSRNVQWLYRLFRPAYPLIRVLFRDYVINTQTLGRAMIHLAQYGGDKQTLESRDIKRKFSP